MTACLLVVYAVPAALPRSPASEVTFTIAPRPASSIAGSTARVRAKVPVTFTAMTFSQSWSSSSWSGTIPSMIPAMLARPSIRSPAASTMRATSSPRVMSATTGMTAPSPASAARLERPSSARSTATTRPPSVPPAPPEVVADLLTGYLSLATLGAAPR